MVAMVAMTWKASSEGVLSGVFPCATCARRRRKSPRARGGVLNSAC